ncbi:MAG: D-glycero-beta-D-manno-heptose-7-phosphate kinase [Acidobacteria bacterium]|nr:MAG: D-glycero-beta-D-manno-heptose-7-phosphate kinase [Acidobacteriota bacterium]
MMIPDSFANIKILIVGDVMLDRYLWGDVSRISPEAPVPIVRLRSETRAPGGAANVAANVEGLGATAFLIGCVGNDHDANAVDTILAEAGVNSAKLVRCGSRQTTVKTRIIAHHQQITRVDQETVEPLAQSEKAELLLAVKELAPQVTAIVLSDYAKGVLDEEVVQATIAIAKTADIPVIVDPKGRDYLKYRGATLLTPNRKEAIEACRMDYEMTDAVDDAGAQLLAENDVTAILITQGEQGMSLFTRSGENLRLPASARDVYDVTGAGDTVIATLAVSLAAELDIKTAARLANTAAGIVVEQVGTTPIKFESLRKAVLES